MGQAITKEKRYSPFEYFKISREAEHRMEYEDGILMDMGQTTDTHEELAFNLKSSIKKEVKGKACKVHMETVSLEVAESSKYYLPDVMLTCDERDHQDRLMKRYPSLVAEIVSPSSSKRDREEKFAAYLKLPSIKYYLLIAQDRIRIDVFSKGEGKGWEFHYYEELAESIPLPQIGISLSVADIYEDVILVSEEETERGA
ncbi:MAG: Uma2 family endonuclease [Bacteroidota bacterium]